MSATLSEAYRNNPLSRHHIIPLDFQSLQAVPYSHQWSQSDDDDISSSDRDHSSIPIVDLEGEGVVEIVGNACETWGVFQLINHGIPSSLQEEVESETRRLFSLPIQQKMKALRSPDGATGYGVARIAPFFSKFLWHEGFTIMGSSVVDHARVLWPHDYQHFCDIMGEWQKKMKALAHKLLLTILKSLNVYGEEEKSWAQMVFGSRNEALQLNSYPSCPDPTRAMGLAPHTDSMLLTILHQSDTNGLQIFRDGLGWVTVSPVTGALTVNVGDLLHIFSNGKFPAVHHRVVVNGTRHRISTAYFYGPLPDSVVAPFSQFRCPMYKSLTVKEYVGIKNKHLEGALSFIRI